MELYDIAIVGGGPGGCAAALELGKSGATVLLIDGDHFPRDKVCGDAIPGPAVKALSAICPDYATSLETLPSAAASKRTRLHLNGHAPITLHWETRAYTCRRINFDQHLLRLVGEKTATVIRTGVKVKSLVRRDGGVELHLDDDTACKAKIVIGADGAHSVVSRQLAGNRLDTQHHGGAVRQYYRGVRGLAPDRLEIHALPEFMPGYFWIFPLADGGCNVGFGMHSTAIRRKGIKLRASLQDFIQASPSLRDRFVAAEPTDAVRGFGLPFGSRAVTVSGDRFLLVGDAACLVDPLTGDGIGQAIRSGSLAARQVKNCLRENDFSEVATRGYAVDLRRAIGRELRIRSAILNAHRRFPFLVNWGARLLSIHWIRDVIRPRL